MDNLNASKTLQNLLGATEKAVASLEGRSGKNGNFENQLVDIQKKFEEADKIKDPKKRELRVRVLQSTLEELRKDVAQEEKDLAQAVLGLNAMLESMGDEYASLNEFSEEEKTLIAKAEEKLDEAKYNRTSVEHAWFFKSSRIAKADQELKEATTRLEEAKIEAKRMARQRLLNADMEKSLQGFMAKVEKTIQIMTNRMQDIERQLKAVETRKVVAFKIKEEAAKALNILDETLNKAEAELKKEEDLLQTFVNGSPEHAAQTAKISDLRASVEKTRGERNTAFVLFQSKDKFAAELEIHERTQMKLRDNQRMWITSLRSDTEERLITFKSRLEAMKAASDQNVAKTLDSLGAEADKRNAEYMATVGAATDRLRMEKIEKHPERIAEIAKAAAAQAEAIQSIRMRESAAIEEFKKQYGIDPTKSSFFHYQDCNSDNSSDAGTF